MSIVIKVGRASYYDGRKHHYYCYGQTADVPDAVASRWVERGLAAWVDAPTPTDPDSVAPVETTADYDAMSMAELRAEAKARGVALKRGMTKADVAAMLMADGPEFDVLEPVDAG